MMSHLSCAFWKPRDRVRVSAEFIRIIMPKTVSIDDTEGQTTLGEKLAALSVEDGQ